VLGHAHVWWDDPENLFENPDFNPPTPRGLAHYWTRDAWGLYVPVLYTAWYPVARFEYDASRTPALDPRAFHAASLLVHGLCALSVYALLRTAMRSSGTGPLPAAIGALVFAIHPVQVEAVAWISGMKDLLCGLFATLALWLYLGHASLNPRDAHSSWRRLTLYLLATLAFALALLSKPVAVVLPLLGIVLDRGLVRRSWPTVIAMQIPWIVLAIPVALVTRQVQPAVDVAAIAPPHVRPLVAGDALAFYLRQVLVPERLALDYSRAPEVVARQPWRWLMWAVPATLAVALWKVRTRARPALVGAMLFVIPLVPVLGFVPFSAQEYSTVADHYLYLPMIGFALVAAWVASRFRARVALGIAVPALVILGARSWFQTWHWRDTRALFTHNLAVNPRSWTAHVNLAADALLRGDGKAAERHARAAQAIRPDDPQIYQNLAMAYQLQGKQPEARDAIEEAVTRLAALVARQPNRPELRHNLARARMIQRTLSAPTTTSTRPGL